MRKINLKRGAVVLLLIAGFATLYGGDKALQLHASLSQQCSKAILLGGYGAGTTGLISSFSNPNDLTMGTFVPFVEAVRFVFDGHGNVSGTSTADYAGYVSPVTFQGTYTVNPNCTGSLTVDAGASGIVHRDLVIVDNGNEVEFVSTDFGVVIAGSMKKQRTGN